MSDTHFATAVEDLAATVYLEDPYLTVQLGSFDEDDLRKIVAVVLEDIVDIAVLNGATNGVNSFVKELVKLHAARALLAAVPA